MWSVVEVRKVGSNTTINVMRDREDEELRCKKGYGQTACVEVSKREGNQIVSTTFLAGDARAWHYISLPLYHKTMDQLETHLDASAGTNLSSMLMY